MRTIFLSGWATPPSIFKAILPNNCELIDTTKLISETVSKHKNIDEILKNIVPKFSEEVHLIGWSTGATIALAISQVTVLKKITLFAPTASFLRNKKTGVGVSPVALKLLIKAIKRDRKLAMINFFKNCGFKNSVDFSGQYTTEQLLNGLTFLKETKIELSPLSFPAQLFHSTKDLIIPLESAQFVAEKLKIQLNLVDGGHSVILNKLPSLTL